MLSYIVNRKREDSFRVLAPDSCKPLPHKELCRENLFCVQTIAERIKFLFTQAGHSKAMVASRSGIRETQIGRWVNGKVPKPHDSSVAKAMHSIGYDPAEAVRFVFHGGDAPALEKTSVKSDQPSIVERQVSSRAANGAGQRMTPSVPPEGSEWRSMWEDYQAALAHCGQLSIRNQRLEDQVADLQETIRAMQAMAATPARLKATAKPQADSAAETHIIDRIVTPEVLAPGVSRKSPNQTPPAKRGAKAG